MNGKVTCISMRIPASVNSLNDQRTERLLAARPASHTPQRECSPAFARRALRRLRLDAHALDLAREMRTNAQHQERGHGPQAGHEAPPQPDHALSGAKSQIEAHRHP